MSTVTEFKTLEKGAFFENINGALELAKSSDNIDVAVIVTAKNEDEVVTDVFKQNAVGHYVQSTYTREFENGQDDADAMDNYRENVGEIVAELINHFQEQIGDIH